ncbi:acyl-CoA dehydrogenase family protein [Candidatus Entotheonella palauensis]|uniref:acyl-CoA dehydrogenase family protein n=1 Tax=Candidatus Entotheonella palauensis TaxID=93172 RepID=UPI000B7F0446|nr:acyl-CoA dehydrogenase family protein [Candidatus Entotheonella palauensis]
MDMILSEEQELLFKTALEFAQQALTADQIESLEGQEPGFDLDVWQQMVDMGWTGIVFPAAYGGADLTLMDLSLIVEACAQAALPSPLFASVIEAGMLIDQVGSDHDRSAWLPLIAAGKTVLTTAILESSGGFEPAEIEMQAETTASGYRLNGAKRWVRDAAVAETLVVLARSRDTASALTLFLVPASTPGVSYQRLSVSGGERLYDVAFADVDLPADAVLGPPGEAWPAVRALHQRGACLKAAELLGIGQAALELTLEYAKTRVQFGNPLGSFQAVQHHCANMYRNLEACRLLTYQAATRLSEGQGAEREVAMAKAKASEVIPVMIQLAHQIHGAVGYYRDYPLGLYHDRALAAQAAYGTSRHYRRRLAQLLRQDPIGFRGRAQHAAS